MLKRMTVANFKAWREADIELGKVTAFFGTNSAGKSSLLQLLLLLKQTKNATDRGLVLDFGGPSDLVNLGTFSDVVHRHDEDIRISWKLHWSLAEQLDIKAVTPNSGELKISDNSLQLRCEVGLRRARPWTYQLAYRFCEVDYIVESQQGLENKFKLDTNSHDFRFLRNRGRAWPLSAPIKTHLFRIKQGISIRMPVFWMSSSSLMRI